MRIRVAKGAGSAYHRRCYRGASPTCGMLHNPEWEAMLNRLEGRWLEVETDHLFSNQFNTAPIEGESESGLRLYLQDIDAIEGDVREGVVKCRWCGGYDHDHDGVCDKCGKDGCLEPIKPLSPRVIA